MLVKDISLSLLTWYPLVWNPLYSLMSRFPVAFCAKICTAFAFWKFGSWRVVLRNSFWVELAVSLLASLTIFVRPHCQI